MYIRDEIKNCKFNGPIKSELLSVSEEYRVLAMLKFACPERFSKLQRKDSPDLQDVSGLIGIEVTSGDSISNHIISSEILNIALQIHRLIKKSVYKKLETAMAIL